MLQIQGFGVICVHRVQGFTSRRLYACIHPCWTLVRGGDSQAEQSGTGQMCVETGVAVGILRMSSGALPSAIFMCFLVSTKSRRGLFFACKCGVRQRPGRCTGYRTTDVPSNLDLELSLTGPILTVFHGELTSNFINQDWEMMSYFCFQDQP